MSIESIEKRLEAATPADWQRYDTVHGPTLMADWPCGDSVLWRNKQWTAADVDLIVAARNTDLRLLLDVAKAAEEFCESWRTGGSIKELVRFRARLSEALDALEAGK